MLKSVFVLAALAATAAAVPAHADVITPVSATASDTFAFFGQYRQENLVNGSGLTGGQHDAYYANMWMTNLGVNQAQVVFDLGGEFALAGADIWNYNFGNPAEFQSTILRGVKDFRLLTSIDGVTFTEIFAGTLAMGTGQPLAAQAFDIEGRARFVQLDILNNYGQGTYAERDWSTGLSEVRFDGVAVPEPATWAMMIGGFGLVGGAMRSRRSLKAVAA